MSRALELSQPTQLELFEPAEIIRPDINIGKWSGWIFSSPWATGLYEAKTHTWKTEFQGSKVNASIRVRPIHGRKRPTTTTFRTFLALIQIWEFSGRPEDGQITFSARQLAKVLNLKSFGASTARRTQEQLDILANTSITWSYAFSKGNAYEERVSDMHLIEGVDYFEQGDFLEKAKFVQKQTVRLSPRLVENMLSGNTKPINYNAFISIQNDSSANLYTLLDIYLSNKTTWERRSKALLFEELEFSGKRYEQRNIRLAKLKEFVEELDGKELSNGKLNLSIKKTADGEDWKLVARRTARAIKGRVTPKLANPKDDIPYIVEDLMGGLAQLGTIKQESAKTLEVLVRWYPRQMLFEVLSLLKADYRGEIKKSVIRAYMYLTHVEAHKRGKEWIKDCGVTCKHRPENRLSVEEIIKRTKA